MRLVGHEVTRRYLSCPAVLWKSNIPDGNTSQFGLAAGGDRDRHFAGWALDAVRRGQEHGRLAAGCIAAIAPCPGLNLTKAPMALLVVAQCLLKLSQVKVRPQGICHIQFGIGELPE
jgi:hypothetical protein